MMDDINAVGKILEGYEPHMLAIALSLVIDDYCERNRDADPAWIAEMVSQNIEMISRLFKGVQYDQC